MMRVVYTTAFLICFAVQLCCSAEIAKSIGIKGLYVTIYVGEESGWGGVYTTTLEPARQPPDDAQAWFVRPNGYIESKHFPGVVLDINSGSITPTTVVGFPEKTPAESNQLWTINADGSILSRSAAGFYLQSAVIGGVTYPYVNYTTPVLITVGAFPISAPALTPHSLRIKGLYVTLAYTKTIDTLFGSYNVYTANLEDKIVDTEQNEWLGITDKSQGFYFTSDGYIRSAQYPGIVLDVSEAANKPATVVGYPQKTPPALNQLWKINPDGSVESKLAKGFYLQSSTTGGTPFAFADFVLVTKVVGDYPIPGADVALTTVSGTTKGALVQDGEYTIIIQAKLADGTPSTWGHDAFVVGFSPPGFVNDPVYIGNGKYSVTFGSYDDDDFTLTIRLGGVDIPGSPFAFTVHAPVSK